MIFEKRITSASALGFPAIDFDEDGNIVEAEYDTLVAQMSDGQNSKLIEVGNPRTPFVRVVLNLDGADHLNVSELIDTIDDEAEAYYNIERLNYDRSWTRSIEGQ